MRRHPVIHSQFLAWLYWEAVGWQIPIAMFVWLGGRVREGLSDGNLGCFWSSLHLQLLIAEEYLHLCASDTEIGTGSKDAYEHPLPLLLRLCSSGCKGTPLWSKAFFNVIRDNKWGSDGNQTWPVTLIMCLHQWPSVPRTIKEEGDSTICVCVYTSPVSKHGWRQPLAGSRCDQPCQCPVCLCCLCVSGNMLSTAMHWTCRGERSSCVPQPGLKPQLPGTMLGPSGQAGAVLGQWLRSLLCSAPRWTQETVLVLNVFWQEQSNRDKLENKNPIFSTMGRFVYVYMFWCKRKNTFEKAKDWDGGFD